MTLRYLLDTGIVSSPISRSPDAGIRARLAEHGANCAIAAPVWHELTYGVNLLPAGKRRARLEGYLHEVVRPSFAILSYDEQAAHWHGAERARLDQLGTPAPFVDGQIAAIAHTNGLVLVTMNQKDFKNFQEIRIENWSE